MQAGEALRAAGPSLAGPAETEAEVFERGAAGSPVGLPKTCRVGLSGNPMRPCHSATQRVQVARARHGRVSGVGDEPERFCKRAAGAGNAWFAGLAIPMAAQRGDGDRSTTNGGFGSGAERPRRSGAGWRSYAMLTGWGLPRSASESRGPCLDRAAA